MRKDWKRVLPIFLVIVFVFALVPVSLQASQSTTVEEWITRYGTHDFQPSPHPSLHFYLHSDSEANNIAEK